MPFLKQGLNESRHLMVAVFLANGFEEIEALTVVDLLRRAGVETVTVGVGSKTVVGTHGIAVCADTEGSALTQDAWDAVVLPGGLPGTTNLEASDTVRRCVDATAKAGGYLCAICAAPSVLGHFGYLQGKRATCYPGFEDELYGAVVTGEGVVQDGKVITAKSAGVSLPFALCVTAALTTPETAAELEAKLQCR